MTQYRLARVSSASTELRRYMVLSLASNSAIHVS
jgi:hypothetical protein